MVNVRDFVERRRRERQGGTQGDTQVNQPNPVNQPDYTNSENGYGSPTPPRSNSQTSQSNRQGFDINIGRPSDSDFDLVSRFEKARNEGRINNDIFNGYYALPRENIYADPFQSSEFSQRAVRDAQERINAFNTNQQERVNQSEQSRLNQQVNQTGEQIGQFSAFDQAILAPYLNATQGGNTDVARNQLQSDLAFADESFRDDQRFINTERDNIENSRELIETRAEDSRQRQADFLNEQKRLEEEQLEINQNRDLERATREKNDAVKQLTRTLALTGGFGSGNANAYLFQTETKMNEVITDIEKQYDLDRKKLSQEFRGNYLQIEENYDERVFSALQDYNSSVSDVNKMTRAAQQSRTSRKQESKNNFYAAIEAANKEQRDATIKLSDKMYEMMKDRREVKTKEQNNLWGQLYDHYNVFGGNNPMMEDQIIQRMEKSGMDTSLIPRGIATTSEINSAQRLMQQRQSQSTGRPLSETTIRLFTDTMSGIQMLEDLDTMFNEGAFDPSVSERLLLGLGTAGTLSSGDSIGPVEGRIKKNIPGTASRKLNSRLKLIKQVIGKAIEGGVLRKEDEIKYDEMLPRVTDEPSLFQDKIDRMRVKLKQDITFGLNNFRAQGFNVEGITSNYDSLYGEEPDQLTPSDAQGLMEKLNNGEEISNYMSYFPEGRITQGFNTPVSSRENGGLYDQSTVDAWGGKHAGLDIAVPVGTDIVAPSDITITEISGNPNSKSGWGMTIKGKDSKGNILRWSHLSNALFKKGDKIRAGEVLALSGNSGNSTGPHIDFRVRDGRSKQYIDPLTYIG